MFEQQLHYGESVIPYRVCYVPGKARRIAIHVHPDGSVQVDAPPEASLREIRQAVGRRARWVCDHVQRIEAQRSHALPREYVSGESHFYLGRRYLLKVRQRQEGQPSVRLVRGRFEVTGEDLDRDKVRDLLWAWYQDHARELFDRRLERIWPELPWVTSKPPWKLLVMKKQWGSCSPRGALILNPHLVKAPSECIDYVLFHELCHLKYHNHSRDFYDLLGERMPRWEAVKARLDGMAELLLNR